MPSRFAALLAALTAVFVALPAAAGDGSLVPLKPLVSTVVYFVVGVALFGAVFALIAKLTPFSIRKEIEEDQNISLAILMGSVFLSLAVIMAAVLMSPN